MPRRRPLIVALLACVLAPLALAQEPTTAQWLSVVNEAGALLNATTRVLRTMARRLGSFAAAGYTGYSVLAAQRQLDRLKDISARATDVVVTRQMPVTASIDGYLAHPAPTAFDWLEVTSRIDQAMPRVAELLADVRNERSDLVLDDTYAQLLSSLQARGDMLTRLSELPPPSTPAQRRALAQLNVEYKMMLAAFQVTLRELNRYIRSAQRP